MRYRPSPNFVLAIIALLCLGYIVYVIPDTVMRWHLEQVAEKATAPSPRRDHRPDISHCMNNPKTWECIIGKDES